MSPFLIDTGATTHVFVLATSVALQLTDCDPLVTMFVVDTGANGTILGRPLHDAGLCSAYTRLPPVAPSTLTITATRSLAPPP